ncbi:MAG: carbohydrate ABC transporter permease [Bacillota bacterium]|nr:carbohydrate ABC transporter permease [Bacillota bacterium]HOB42971.1 carbohydrate ABC transporter permease [Bacillota bacterium]HOL52272.1 carbohydrate ABC transporter permease [Bacillota bacterium]HQD80756.1 carbohydrate ABC transporter permease [Bacillota bacterium]
MRTVGCSSGHKVITYVAAGLIALIWLIPFLGVFMASIRPLSEINRGWWRFDSFTPTFKNYVGAWNHPAAPISEGMLNSLKVAIPATIIPVFVASIAAYGFARFKFRGRDQLFILVVALMTLPQQMIAVPMFQMMNKLGAVDSYSGLILVHSAWGIPWALYFMRNYFTTLPIEVEEAAKVDGASDWRIFFQIIMPMALPAIASAAVLQFMWVWSDFFLALILIYSPAKLLATQRVPLLRGIYHVDWGILAAGSIIVMAVPIIVFAVMQRYYIRGMVGWVSK